MTPTSTLRTIPAAPRSVAWTARPITVCIINHDGAGYLRETLDAVFAHAPRSSEILLVDNDSSDDGVDTVRRDYPTVRVVALGDNRGPGAARNAGFRTAAHDLILFVDNDVSLAAGCAEQLLAALEADPTAAVAMPCVLHADDEQTIQYQGADSHFLGMMSLRDAGMHVQRAESDPRSIGSLVTACFIVDRSKWPGADPFDESFFIYFEDHDFALQVRELGHEILSVPRARCLHRSGTPGLSLRQSDRYSRTRVFCVIRNRWQVIAKHYQARTLVRLAPLLLLYELAQLAGVIHKGWLREWLAAAWWMVRHAPRVLRKRRELQRRRVTPDRELLGGGAIPFTPQLTRGRGERVARRWLDRVVCSYWRRMGCGP